MWPAVALFGAALATAACVPVPVSTVPLHQREERPFALESEPSDNDGTFASPVFDSTGAWIAAYDAGKPVGLAVIATVDGNTGWSFTSYDPMVAHHLTARFEHWQLARLAKAELRPQS